ncbi:MAG: DUF3108 domain-containing protein [Candidatus Krumholzibacteria bacterium]|nr:DUF3108 domain-containing protein [Candidatus Krumholzibacteria bacterium]
MRVDISNGRIPVILLLTLCVLFSGQFSVDLQAQDTAHVVTYSGKDHGYEMIKGFELVHPVPDIVPFGEGEYLVFAIQYGLIYAGDATLEVRSNAELNGRQAYHLVSVARTNKAFDIVYKVRDKHESYMDMKNLYSLRFEKHLREGKFRRDKVVEFDQVKHVAIYPDKEVGIPPGTQDFISALYYVRTIPLEPGQAVWMPNHSDGKNYPMFVKALRREQVEVQAGKFDCLVIEPVLETSAIFENTGKLTIWITDDNFRMPVLMRSKVAVGSFEAVLKEFTLASNGPRVIEKEGLSP